VLDDAIDAFHRAESRLVADADPVWLQDGAPHVWRPYCQHETAAPPLPVVAGRGSRLVLADGNELVDGIASWWTVVHGYGHPHIQEGVARQLRTLPHVAFGGLANEPAYTLAARLVKLLPRPLSRVFFAESGSVSVEVAVKMAIQSFQNRGRPRSTVVAFEGAYHGDTFATMSLSDPEDGMHRAFRGLGVPVVHLPLPRANDGGAFERALERVASELSCVIVEPLVQCAGGMRFHDAEALQRIRRACDAHGAWLVFDEIATGFFRTGTRFAMDRAGVVPDIVTLGKALTGGNLPLAAAVASDAVFEAFSSQDASHALQHGPTYMGHALACAAAHASLDLFEREDYAEKARALEGTMRAALAPLEGRPHVREVRCRGGIGVVEMEPGSAPASDAFASRGAFVRPLRLKSCDVVYLMPPLVIERADLEVLLAAIDDAIPVG
jgi:adenosylmethionine-8-amino-7-oxononanoate aminotransferase